MPRALMARLRIFVLLLEEGKRSLVSPTHDSKPTVLQIGIPISKT